MKKICLIILSVCLLFMPVSIYAEEESLDLAVNASAAYLIEASSGTVIFEKNSNEQLYPASMTKMMGLLLVFEAIHNGKLSMSDMITTSAHAASMGGSQVYLEENETMSLEEMLHAICIASANDAMVAVAEAIGGTHQGFVHMMNEKAKQLNLENTNFVNCTGLHDANHYTCAKDMGIIAQALLKEGKEELLAITSKYDSYIRENSENKFWLVNTNKLLKQVEGADGLKTGFTQEAMSCITATAKRGELRLIGVVMKEPDGKTRNSEMKQLLEYGFSKYDQAILYPKDTILEEYTVENGKPKNIQLLNTNDLGYVYLKGEEPSEVKKEIEITNTELPYEEGEIIGSITIEMSNGFIMKSDIKTDRRIERLGYLDILLLTIQNVIAA